MHCPFCHGDDSRVLDSRTSDDGVRRRRECLGCAGRFTTYERIEATPIYVRKRDGRREPFSREKLLAGVRRACEKRPLDSGALDALVDTVSREVYGRASAEVPSTWVGELVMDQLKHLDGIAYVRFASVYRPFADLDALRDVLNDLEHAAERAIPDNQLSLLPLEPVAPLAAGPPGAHIPPADG